MCKFGYELDASGYCAKVSTGSTGSMLAANYTQVEMDELLQIQKEEDYAIALNVATFAAWVTAVVMGLIGGVFFLRRKVSRSSNSEHYEALLIE